MLEDLQIRVHTCLVQKLHSTLSWYDLQWLTLAQNKDKTINCVVYGCGQWMVRQAGKNEEPYSVSAEQLVC